MNFLPDVAPLQEHYDRARQETLLFFRLPPCKRPPQELGRTLSPPRGSLALYQASCPIYDCQDYLPFSLKDRSPRSHPFPKIRWAPPSLPPLRTSLLATAGFRWATEVFAFYRFFQTVSVRDMLLLGSPSPYPDKKPALFPLEHLFSRGGISSEGDFPFSFCPPQSPSSATRASPLERSSP